MTGNRIEYEMTEQDRKDLIAAARPIPYSARQRGDPSSPHRAIMAVWSRLADRMGFEVMTVECVPKKGDRFFTADERVVCDG